MEKEPNRREFLKKLGGAALTAGAIGLGVDKAKALGDYHAKDLDVDMSEVTKKGAEEMDRLYYEIERLEKDGDAERAEELREKLNDYIRQLQRRVSPPEDPQH